MATLRRSRFLSLSTVSQGVDEATANSVSSSHGDGKSTRFHVPRVWNIWWTLWILRLRPTWLSDEEEHQGCLVCVLFCWLPFLIAKCQILRWRDFIQTRDDCVGLESSVVMSPKVWEASGHVENFVDPLVECKKWLCPLTVLTPHPPPLSQHMYCGSKTLLDRCCLSNLLCCYAAIMYWF